MEAMTMENPDVGARTVSDRIALEEAGLPGAPYITGLVVLPGAALAAAGDEGVWAFPLSGIAPEKVLNLGALPLAAALPPAGDGMVVGTDDGRLLLVRPDGSKRLLAYQDGVWVDQIAVHAATGRIACGFGKTLMVFDEQGAVVAERKGHASTVAGVAFSADGRQIAVSHYGGVTVWPSEGPAQIGERLEWHGSHLSVAWSPDGQFIATAMQEKELHSWRMPHGKSLRMSGYPAKIRSLSWMRDGRYLAVSGADVVTAWDFGDGGPSGKAPLEFGYAFNQVVTEVVANPARDLIAGAYDDGSTMIGAPQSGEAMIARPGDGASVTKLVWSPDGSTLVAGSAKGGLATMRLKDQPLA